MKHPLDFFTNIKIMIEKRFYFMSNSGGIAIHFRHSFMTVIDGNFWKYDPMVGIPLRAL